MLSRRSNGGSAGLPSCPCSTATTSEQSSRTMNGSERIRFGCGSESSAAPGPGDRLDVRLRTQVSIHVTSTAPSDWDAYVERHPSASAYHRARAVSIGAEAFGLPTIYVAARGHGGELKGVLPLVEQSSFAFGKFLSSVPFFTYGGLLSDDDGTTAAIADAAVDIAKSRRVDHLELRHTFPLLPRAFSVRTDKLSMVLKLPES